MKPLKRAALILFGLLPLAASAQKKTGNLVYVDGQGVMRYTNGNAEAAFFGVNYTVPFAYGYRSHKALGIDPEKAIDADVAHLARLGLDAFRVHMWDVEISDSAGNLLNNEHLRLFDYLLMRLKERQIKILVTPIAFWGNGYPERDEKTPGFATKYGKGPSVVKEEAILAQERYLQQLFTHVNPYTKQTYGQDPDVIAVELNNEPHHSGPRERATEYINRLAAALRGTGWTKPVFYNISESPAYAGAVAAANVDGHSFQWYPTGLVANRELKGNFLPNVDQYHIPFFDSIPSLKKRALMLYEFDAGDVVQSNMYPAMARSFRAAGFQWATQFAYDPVYTAHANTEYQTHFLNLLYTPGKAISLLIAGKAFHQLPRGKSWGTFPADTSFGEFRVSYVNNLSEWNSDTAFCYSNSTATRPRNAAQLRHVAGVGSSPVVQYEGSGAYFLDRLPNGNWRLELMPDALQVNDPFGKASPARDVVRLLAAANRMELFLPGLPGTFKVVGLDSSNRGVSINGAGGFLLKPGVYEIGASPKAGPVARFAIPKISTGAPYLAALPAADRPAGKAFPLSFQAGNVEERDNVSVELRHSLNRWKTLQLQRRGNHVYTADVPAELLEPGLLEYRVLVRRESGETYVFPSGQKEDPYSWDNTNDARYTIRLIPEAHGPVLFDASADRNRVMPWLTDWRRQSIGFSFSEDGGNPVLRATIGKAKSGETIHWRLFAGEQAIDTPTAAGNYLISVRARSRNGRSLTVTLVDRNGKAVETSMALRDDMATITVPLSMFHQTPFYLLPRPYPGFQPLQFRRDEGTFDIRLLEHLDFSFGDTGPASAAGTDLDVELERVQLHLPRPTPQPNRTN
ncbi:MAG: membrane or secreted protein [Chitinophagaceae bacterium]|nr:MAG: membrane or secreted protein [Chitinophagaceae bacterium]